MDGRLGREGRPFALSCSQAIFLLPGVAALGAAQPGNFPPRGKAASSPLFSAAPHRPSPPWVRGGVFRWVREFSPIQTWLGGGVPPAFSPPPQGTSELANRFLALFFAGEVGRIGREVFYLAGL